MPVVGHKKCGLDDDHNKEGDDDQGVVGGGDIGAW